MRNDKLLTQNCLALTQKVFETWRGMVLFFKIRVKKYIFFPFCPDGVLSGDLPENV